jgi:ABC-2 type transport system permease protein
MMFSIRQEFFKLLHRKIVWISPIVMLGMMILVGYSLGEGDTKLLTTISYDAPDWIMLLLVVVGSTIFSMEYQNNAILTLLYKASNRVYVYFSKFIVIFCYNVVLHVIGVIFTIILRLIRFNGYVSWSTIYRYHQPIWENMLKTTVLDIFSVMLVISLIFLLSCLISDTTIVTSVGFLTIFIGQMFSAKLMSLPKFAGILKWNPLNMTNLTRQYYNYLTYHDTSHLSNLELIIGTVTYTIIFFGLGYLVFRKKRY